MAQRLRFLRPFDHRIRATLVVAYPAGPQPRLVPGAAAKAALEAGAAELVNDRAAIVNSEPEKVNDAE